ncbi:MAG TPA: dTDP-4-dehydrorhamnose 3,5-epimerase [Rhizomicrobium sp.]|jgi:dTDP-4-dehydrorhamnose 3,5-epimerase|nr:dTDP-4-dehydrorhamnose 3,5-epimerase [Rhizomicrobium sp.]
MLFHKTPLATARLVELQKLGDDRGFFARAFCAREFEREGLENVFVQVNNSFTPRRGTLRGLHYQLPPAAEVKLVRCVRGSFYDLILDLRPDSPTFGQSFGATLSAENRLMMYAPRGFAHAILTLEDETEAMYFVSSFHAPGQERGVRWNDGRFAIEWPMTPVEISAKDGAWPDFNAAFHGVHQLAGLI